MRRRALLIAAVYLAVQTAVILMTGGTFEDTIQYVDCEAEDMTAECDAEGVVRIDRIYEKDGEITADVVPLSEGDANVAYIDSTTGEEVTYAMYRVSGSGMVTRLDNGNFTGYRVSEILIAVFLCASAALVWTGYHRAHRELKYSYEEIFCMGYGLWLTLIAASLILCIARGYDMMNVYEVLKSGASMFVLLTSPAVLIFAVSLSVSNISLIRHEGFGFSNVLGILLSFLMILGEAAVIFLDNTLNSGSEFEIRIYGAVISLFSCIYALFECFLTGAVICGTRAAKHVPEYDKDFIVILGCQIRKDGKLYPLLRARVDRAVDFYEEQLKRTGKKAVLIPSGGQGRNETMAEADAMKNYLMEEKGFDPEQIRAENRSANTKENMAFSKRIAEGIKADGKAAFSTTNYHVFRSGIIAREAGFDADGMGSPTKWYFWPNAYIREVVGLVSYEWRALVLLFIPVAAFFCAIQYAF